MNGRPGQCKSFLDLVNGLDWLTDFKYRVPVHANEEEMVSALEMAYMSCDYSPWQVRSMFRENVGMEWGTGGGGDARCSYIYKCLGHRVSDKVFFPFPKLCVLIARNVAEGRWECAEESIAEDDLACLFYSRFVMKGRRLPWKMHSQVMMRSFLGSGCALRSYLAQFTAQKNLL